MLYFVDRLRNTLLVCPPYGGEFLLPSTRIRYLHNGGTRQISNEFGFSLVARHFALSKEFAYFVINKTVKAVIAPNPYHYIYTLNEKIHSDHASLCTVRLRAGTDADAGRML